MYLMARVFRIRSEGGGAWLYNRPGFLLPEQRYQRRNHTEYTHSIATITSFRNSSFYCTVCTLFMLIELCNKKVYGWHNAIRRWEKTVHVVFKYQSRSLGGDGSARVKKHLPQGGHKEMSSISWMTNSALVYEPKCVGGRGCGVSANEYRCAHGAQINFGDITPYLTNDLPPRHHPSISATYFPVV